MVIPCGTLFTKMAIRKILARVSCYDSLVILVNVSCVALFTFSLMGLNMLMFLIVDISNCR